MDLDAGSAKGGGCAGRYGDLVATFEEWAALATEVRVDGLRLAVQDEGSGPVVTFLHGYPSSSLDAVPLFERLAGSARLVTLDLPGFGASAKPPEHQYSIHGAADAVEGVWAYLGITGGLVVAHDYSVSVAQELLARRLDEPNRAAAITGVVWCNGGLWPDLSCGLLIWLFGCGFVSASSISDTRANDISIDTRAAFDFDRHGHAGH